MTSAEMALDGDVLAARVAAGDDSAFDTLYLQLFQPLVEFAYQYVGETQAAEDLVQDVFQSYWDARTERSIRGVRVYMYSAVKKRALNHRRHRHVVERTANEADPDRPPGHGAPPRDPASEVDASDLRVAIDRIVDELPADRRTIILLRWKHGMGYPEIAQLLDISVSTAQAQVSRVQRAVRPLLRHFIDPV